MGGEVVHSISIKGNCEHSCCVVITGNEVMAIIIWPDFLTRIFKFIIHPHPSSSKNPHILNVKSYFKYNYITHPSPSFNMTSLNIRVEGIGMFELEVNTEWKAMVSERKRNFINWVTVFNSSKSHHNVSWQCSETTILVFTRFIGAYDDYLFLPVFWTSVLHTSVIRASFNLLNTSPCIFSISWRGFCILKIVADLVSASEA